MLIYSLVFVAGGVTSLLVARRNPWLKRVVFGIAAKVEDKIEEELGKNI